MYFIGIDVGTSSVKVLALDEKGVIKKTVGKSYPLSHPYPLWSEQNPNDWWLGTKAALEELFVDVDRQKVVAIGLSGQMHGMVILDKNSNVIRPAILWNDQRTAKQCDYLNKEIGTKKLIDWTANIAYSGFTAPKLLWVKENEPENFAKINKVVLPKDYIAYMFSGVFATDFSDASGTLYLDVQNRKWSKEMLEIIGLTEENLPTLYESFDTVGTILPDLADELGLSKDVKIVIGAGDQAGAAVGGGIIDENGCSISLGTSGAVFAKSNNFVYEKNGTLHAFCDATGRYHVMGVTLAAAASLKWYVEEILQTDDYEVVLTEVENASIEENVYYLPYLSGERTPHNNPNAKGSFVGMEIQHKRKDMTRALLEGVCYSIKDCFTLLHELNVRPADVMINGGGARNDVWCQMLADVLGVKVKKLSINEGPALGAAILAGFSVQGFSSLQDAMDKIIKVASVFEPQPKNTGIYSRKYQHYTHLYQELKDFFAEISQ